MIEEWDVELLGHLTNISSEEDAGGFRLFFDFSKNEYFSNTRLIKSYKLTSHDGDVDVEEIHGDEINWLAGKDLTQEKKKKKKKGSDKGQVQMVPRSSFFHFFAEFEEEEDEDEQKVHRPPIPTIIYNIMQEVTPIMIKATSQILQVHLTKLFFTFVLPGLPSFINFSLLQLQLNTIQNKQRSKNKNKKKKYSGVHPRVSTLIQPSFQNKQKKQTYKQTNFKPPPTPCTEGG